MIHKAYTKGVLAERYYAKLGKVYNQDQARKQFAQEKNLNEKILLQVLKEIFNEQKNML